MAASLCLKSNATLLRAQAKLLRRSLQTNSQDASCHIECKEHYEFHYYGTGGASARAWSVRTAELIGCAGGKAE